MVLAVCTDSSIATVISIVSVSAGKVDCLLRKSIGRPVLKMWWCELESACDHVVERERERNPLRSRKISASRLLGTGCGKKPFREKQMLCFIGIEDVDPFNTIQ